jgi:hypothetical protein
MKTPEDEAFDDLAKKQGSWGGGFPAKRAMAADKFIAAEERKVGERYGYVPKLHPSEWMNAQPAQEPVKHWSDCAVHNGPAYPPGECDCGVAPKSEREVLKLALRALETLMLERGSIYEQAIIAIKEALAQPAQEPIGSLSVRHFRGSKAMTNTDFDYTGDLPEGDYELYTAPPQRPWVGLTDEDIPALLPEADGCAEADVKRVEVQPGFWGEECSLIDAWSFPLVMQILSAHEAALKEKNNGT